MFSARSGCSIRRAPSHLSGYKPSRPQSVHLPCFQGLECRGVPGDRERLRETVRLPTFSVSLVFYMLWRHARLQIDSIGLPTLNGHIVFYMLWKHARLHIDSIGLPVLDVSIVFYWLWSHARVQLDSIGLHSLSVSIAFCIHGSSNIQVLFPPLLALQFEGLHLTFLVTSQAGPSPRTFCVHSAYSGTPNHCRRPSGDTDWLHWITHIERLYCVLHILAASQDTDRLH